MSTWSDFERRIDHLESDRPPPACPTCQAWPPLRVVFDDDGTPPPDVCSTCGRAATQLVMIGCDTEGAA